VRRYNGPANGVDSAMAMAVRGFTDLYVTGTSVDSGYDYLTVKYSAATGDTVWTARYNGIGFGNDIPRAIALRAANEVFITGSSQSALGDYDYLTVRYDANGVLQWDSRYDGGGDDQAYDMALNGGNTIFRNKEGIERFLITDINNPAAGAKAQSTIATMWDRLGIFPGRSKDGFAHIPGGCNVLHLDGHVEFIRYPGKFPVTAASAVLGRAT